MDLLDKIVSQTKITLIELFQGGYLTDNMISNYNEMSRENLHSWLQYTLIRSAEPLGLKPVPEIKLHYSKRARLGGYTLTLQGASIA